MMNRRLTFCIAASILAFSGISYAAEDHANHMDHADHAEKKKSPTLRLTLLPQETPTPGKPMMVTVKLLDLRTGHALTESDLTTVHTQKLHLLVIDQSLSD